MDRPEQERLFTCASSVETAIGLLDLDRLRVIFRALFDEADRRLQRTGYDHDEIEIRRFLRCNRKSGMTIRISTDSLADRKTLIKHLQSGLVRGTIGECANPDVLDHVVVAQAEIDVVRDDWKWYGG